jgi:hypothetical protein
MRDKFRGSIRNRERLPRRFNEGGKPPILREFPRFNRSPVRDQAERFNFRREPRLGQRRSPMRRSPMRSQESRFPPRNDFNNGMRRVVGIARPFRENNDNFNRGERPPFGLRRFNDEGRPPFNRQPFRTDRNNEMPQPMRNGIPMRGGRPIGIRGGATIRV